MLQLVFASGTNNFATSNAHIGLELHQVVGLNYGKSEPFLHSIKANHSQQGDRHATRPRHSKEESFFFFFNQTEYIKLTNFLPLLAQQGDELFTRPRTLSLQVLYYSTHSKETSFLLDKVH